MSIDLRRDRRRDRHAALLAGSLFLLAACGGGGGGSDDDSPGPGPGPTPANVAPVANAGADRAVDENTLVTLSAAASTDSDGTIRSYAWTQTSGTPGVTLGGSTTVTASFTAPDVSAATTLVFRLVVTDDDGATAQDSVQIVVNPVAVVPPSALQITAIELAQTHVLPTTGRSWSLTNGAGATQTETLHFTGGRDALALVGLSAADAAAPRLEGVLGGISLGTVALDPPSLLPPTEAGGPAYATDRWSATVPAAWMKPGVQFRASSSNHPAGALSAAPEIGGDFTLTLRTLPFYLFGANESNTARPLSITGAPDAAGRQEAIAKWPIAALAGGNHPAGKVEWSYLVMGPGQRGGVAEPARVATSIADYRDGFTGLGVVLGILNDLQAASGEDAQAVHYYAPVLAIDARNNYSAPGGGLGTIGGAASTGDEKWAGIFIHEVGHAYGLPHAGEAYDASRYPYEWGSLKGSNWGYDLSRREFLAPFLPTTALTYSGCASDSFGGHPRALDSSNRCVKQDPMQSGSDDQASGYRYTAFSDFSTAVMQRFFEGVTSAPSGGGAHTYSGGKLVRDTAFPGGYKRWDTIDHAWVNVDDSTTGLAQNGFNKGLPLQRDVPVYSIVFAISKAGTAGVTRFYPPIRYTGNLLQTVDAFDSAALASITPGGSAPFRWYCINSGCDYTLRVYYAGGTQRHIVIKGGFRAFNNPTGAFPASATNPLDGDSFETFAVNVPGDLAITGLQLLDTPMAWTASPTILTPVLATYP